MAEHELSILVRAKGALQAARDIGKVNSAVGSLGQTASRGVRTAGRNLAIMGTGFAVGIGAAAKAGITSLADLEDATTSVAGAIKQVGIDGQVSANQVATWANDIERAVGAAFDDKDITAATATLIRFGKVTPKNLMPAMQVMTNLAVKTGSVDSAATLLAKALADPEKAAGKLARTGVILTKSQQDQIKAMVKAGDVAGAQKLILDELNKTTKGAALASQGPYRRSLAVLADVTEDAQRALGEGFLPVLMKVSDLLQGELAKPSTIANIRQFGQGLASGLDDLIDIARQLPWATIGDSLKLAGAGAKTVLSAFSSLPPWVQTAVLTGWGLNKLTGGALGSIAGELGKGLVKGVLGMTAGVVNIKAGTVVGAGGVPPVTGAAGGGAKGLLGSLLKVAVVGAVVVEGFALWAQSVGDFAQQNSDLKDKGLNQAEIAAMRYYEASASDQATMAKRLGRIPTIAEWQSALAKLNKPAPGTNESGGRSSQDNDPDKRSWRNQKEELVRIREMVNASKDDTVTAVGKTTAAAQETKRETSRGAAIVSSTTRSSSLQNAGIISAAIARNRAIVNTSVAVYVSGTSVTTSVTKTTRSGGGGASRETDKNAAKHV